MARAPKNSESSKDNKSKIIKTIPSSETGMVDCANGKYIIIPSRVTKDKFNVSESISSVSSVLTHMFAFCEDGGVVFLFR